jgi:hypothetical protein
MTYQEAKEKFNAELRDNAELIRVANHYGMTIDRAVILIQPNLKVLRYRNGMIKEVSVNISDSSMNIKHKINF